MASIDFIDWTEVLAFQCCYGIIIRLVIFYHGVGVMSHKIGENGEFFWCWVRWYSVNEVANGAEPMTETLPRVCICRLMIQPLWLEVG